MGLMALPGDKTSYDIIPYLPDTSAIQRRLRRRGAAPSKARLNPELLMIESDHDLRNPSDMFLLERVAKAVLHTTGIALVQSITRPLGTPLDHTRSRFRSARRARVRYRTWDTRRTAPGTC